jgi:hypothetical protein
LLLHQRSLPDEIDFGYNYSGILFEKHGIGVLHPHFQDRKSLHPGIVSPWLHQLKVFDVTEK